MPRFLPDLMGMGVALVLPIIELSTGALVPSFTSLLILLGLASFKTLDAEVSDDESGGASGGDDDSDNDASDSAGVLCNTAGLRNDKNASACCLLRRDAK